MEWPPDGVEAILVLHGAAYCFSFALPLWCYMMLRVVG